MLLDASTREIMMLKNTKEAIVIIESITTNDQQVQYNISTGARTCR